MTGFANAMGSISPLLMAMGADLRTPAHQRDPRTMQIGIAQMMQQQQAEAQRQQDMEARQGLARAMAAQGIPAEMGGVLQALGPQQGAQALLGMMQPQRAQTSEFERLLAQLPPEQRDAAIRMRAGLEPDANMRLRVGAQQQDRDPIAALRARAAEAGLQPGTPEYAQFMMAGGAGSGMAIDVGPDGAISFRQGAGAAAQRPFTEGQSKDNVYTVRARGALETLEKFSGALTSFGERALNLDPTGALRGQFQSDEFQIAQQAGEEFLQAILRKDTGAAITSQEQDLYGKTYLPQPGDNPAVLQQKAQARQRAIAAIEAGMSPAQMIAVEKGLAASGGEPQRPDDWTEEEWSVLTPEERRQLGGSGAANPSLPAGAAGLVDKIAFVESGNNPRARNPRSTATGAGQFIESTWLNMIERHRPDLAAMPREAVLDLRNDPEISREMIVRYAMDNAQGLQSAGLPVDKGTLYLAHFAGLGGARAVLSAPDAASVADILGDAVIKANPFLKGKTAGWLRNWAARKMGVGA